MNTILRYDIVDNRTGAIVGKAKTLAGARRSVGRRDNAYGGYRYSAKPVYVPAGLTYYVNSLASARDAFERNGPSMAIVDRVALLARSAKREGETRLALIIEACAADLAAMVA